LERQISGEARLLVECASLEETIRICTSAGAALCAIDDETRSLQPGRRADLLFIDGDLRNDVRRLVNPRLIVRIEQRF
jgi:imidazolonepropionase-like amidohydrolase